MLLEPAWTRMWRRQFGSRAVAEDGYATVWAVGWMVVVALVTWAALLVAAGVGRQHHLDGAADLAAISAAQAVQRGEDACREAARVAAANHVQVARCEVVDADVVVQVVDELDLPLDLTLRIVGRARAGPG